MASPWDILGVTRAASLQEIRTAYRRLSKESHPDRHGQSDDARERFLRIQAAYALLCDPEARGAYERDPDGALEHRIALEKRKAQLSRRKRRLRQLYDD